MKGIIIAGTHSGCGKTTVTIGLLAALKNKGLKVQPFKAGPDFIDTGLHGIVINRPSRNLDIWMCGKDYVKECFRKNTDKTDIAIVEGVMGLFDGGEASTSEVAKILGIPIVLVVNARSMAESAAAIVKGFETLDPEIKIAGVIFNKAAGERHLQMLSDAVKNHTNVKILGYLPMDMNFEIPHRHLGLAVAEEKPISAVEINKLVDAVLKCIDVDKIAECELRIADCRIKKSEIRPASGGSAEAENPKSPPDGRAGKIRIAIAYDKAFSFYYEDNLDLLREAGAQIVPFSPLSDSCIPEGVDAMYIGGGYPELYADALSKNKSMLEDAYVWSLSGKPLYAECGGLMYLSKGIYDFDGKFYKMAGIFPFEAAMKQERVNLGYREIMLKENCILGRKNSRLRGHEFHYSEIRERTRNKVCHSVLDTESMEDMDSRLKTAGMTEHGIQAKIYSVKNGSGQALPDEGYRFKNTFASYVHIHFGSNPDIARNFVRFCSGT